MAFTVAAARVRVGLEPTDTSKDAELQASMDVAVESAELYLNRFLPFKEQVTEVLKFLGNKLFLSRYPVTDVQSLDGSEIGYKVNKSLGVVHFDAPVQSDQMTVTYTGGYMTYPPTLEQALWSIFDRVWSAVVEGTSTTGEGEIKSVTVPDVGTIVYNVAAADEASHPFIGAGTEVLLSYYRRLLC